MPSGPASARQASRPGQGPRRASPDGLGAWWEYARGMLPPVRGWTRDRELPMFSVRLVARADVIQHWPAAGVELQALLKKCGPPGERIEDECIRRRMGLDYYLRDVVAAAPEEFARRKQMWPEWRRSLYAKVFPVFKTSGDPFVVFTIYREAEGELVVTA